MLTESAVNVLQAYKKLKQNGGLPTNLANPTIANLRNECATTYLKRPHQNIKVILESFERPGFEILEAKDILNIDPEKFKPLQKYMQESVFKPSLKTTELLAWLIDFNEAPESNEKDVSKNTGLKPHYWKFAGVGAIVVACLVGGYVKVFDKQCMQWNGQKYVAVHCDNEGKVGDIVALKSEKIDGFYKILKPDTITYNSIGKVWYLKMNKKLEFYTDSGTLPADRRKELRPITKYIIDKYIYKKTL